jgi:cold shock CspA family protein
MTKLSKQQAHRGIVIVSKFDADWIKGFGFIEPIGDGARENNVFFSGFATKNAPTEKGDEVDFIYSDRKREQGPSAHRVWLRKRAVENDDDREHITTLRGEFET